MSWLLVFAFLAVFTSQSLVDLADTIIVVVALIFAFKNQEVRIFFQGFKPVLLWPVWITVLIIGLIFNIGFSNLYAWLDATEFKWIISFLSLIYLAKDITDRAKFFFEVSVTILLLNIASIILFFVRHEYRAGGIFDAVMAFSHNIAPIFCLYTVYTFVNWSILERRMRIFFSAIVLSSAFLTTMTFTRGVWIGSLLAIGITLLIWNFKVAIKILLAISIVCVVLLGTNQNIYERAFSKTVNESNSNNERLSLWKANWRIVEVHPILGVGFGQNRNYLRKYYDEMGFPADMIISHAHNQYLQLWAGTGSLGLLCFLIFLFGVFRSAWAGCKNSIGNNRGMMFGLFSGLLCFVIGALTEANFNISKNRFLFLLLAGLAMGFSEKMTAGKARSKI